MIGSEGSISVPTLNPQNRRENGKGRAIFKSDHGLLREDEAWASDHTPETINSTTTARPRSCLGTIASTGLPDTVEKIERFLFLMYHRVDKF
jgi:hypothetical protein